MMRIIFYDKKNTNDNKKRMAFFKRVKQQWVLVDDLVTNVSLIPLKVL